MMKNGITIRLPGSILVSSSVRPVSSCARVRNRDRLYPASDAMTRLIDVAPTVTIRLLASQVASGLRSNGDDEGAQADVRQRRHQRGLARQHLRRRQHRGDQHPVEREQQHRAQQRRRRRSTAAGAARRAHQKNSLRSCRRASSTATSAIASISTPMTAARAHVEVPERLVVGADAQRLGRLGRAAAGRRVDDVELPERPQAVQHQRERGLARVCPAR